MEFNLYKREEDLAKKVEKIIDEFYGSENKREQDKKKQELFHLLVLLDICETHINGKLKNVIPNEPGDAVIIDEMGNKHLVEIFRVFGDKENKLINEKMKNIFKLSYEDIDYANFDREKMSQLLLKKLDDKNQKDYLMDNQYNTKTILVITCEHDRCSVCGDWLITYIGKDLDEKMKLKKYDYIYVVDYMASGKDEGPIAYNLEERINICKSSGLI